MAAVPVAEEEDARRPNRERENLVTERTRIANQMKAILVRFGIRSFKRGNPEVCSSGIRHVDGAKLNLALVRNVRTCCFDAKGEVTSG